MRLRKLKEAFTIKPKNLERYKVLKDAGTQDGSSQSDDFLDLETLNSGGIKEFTNKKTGRKFWMKEKYKDFEDQDYSDEFENLDFMHQDIRGFIEYTSYSILRYLKRYAPEIRIPNKVRLGYSYSKTESTFQVLTSSYRKTKQAGETTKGNVYRNLVIDTFLFLILMGNSDFHKGNLIVKNKEEYYMIDPEISLQNYENALKEGRDIMEIYIEPYFKYSQSFEKIERQYKIITNMDVDSEFGPIIDRCIETAIKAIIKDGNVNIDDIKNERNYLKNIKKRILANLNANRVYITKEYSKYVGDDRVIKHEPQKRFLRKT